MAFLFDFSGLEEKDLEHRKGVKVSGGLDDGDGDGYFRSEEDADGDSVDYRNCRAGDVDSGCVSGTALIGSAWRWLCWCCKRDNGAFNCSDNFGGSKKAVSAMVMKIPTTSIMKKPIPTTLLMVMMTVILMVVSVIVMVILAYSGEPRCCGQPGAAFFRHLYLHVVGREKRQYLQHGHLSTFIWVPAACAVRRSRFKRA